MDPPRATEHMESNQQQQGPSANRNRTEEIHQQIEDVKVVRNYYFFIVNALIQIR